jgi:hypothetical protein
MERYLRRNDLRQLIALQSTLVLTVLFSFNGNAREFVTDRPDRTESPYTVDAGRYQFETDIFTYNFKRQNVSGQTVTTQKYFFNQINLKAGLSPKADLQMIIPTFVMQDTDTAGVIDNKRGFGDILVRFKMNLFGNDEGPIALGVMPFLKTPTATANLGNSRFEGGVILPIALHLPKEWELGTMAQVNYVKNENDNNFHATFISSISFGHPIVGDLSGYVEFYSESSGENGANWIATTDVGLTYMSGPNTQWDIGMNVGVTPATDAINPFFGLSMRF